MVDVVQVKPPEQVRGRPFPKRRPGRIRAFQPEGEFPLQTRCRSSGRSFIGQPQDARSASLASDARFRPEPKVCDTGKGVFRGKAPGRTI